MKFYKETNFKETPIGKIPEDWEIAKLRNVCKFKRGFSYRSNQITKDPTKVRFITINDFEKEGGLKRDAEKVYIKENVELDPDFFLNTGDVLIANTDMSRGFIIGAPVLIEDMVGKLVYSMDLTKLIFNRSKVEGKFLFYYLTYKPVRQKMKAFAQGTNVLHLNHSLVKNMKIPLPPLEEQKAIAHILSTVDEAIQKANEIIEKVKRLKKGLMQELLTKGIGHKEFKDTEIGRIPKEWKVVRLKDVVEKFISGGTPSTKEPKFWNGDIPWMTSAHITKWYVDSGERFITKEGLKKSTTNIVPKGNVIVATRVGIGKSAFNLIDIAINQDLTGLIINKCKVDAKFLVWYLISPKVVRILLSFTRGTTIKGISRRDLERLKVPLPLLSEQQKIAEVLSSVDNVLRLKRMKKEKLERMKRAMMDLLLTGKVRVRV